MGKKSSKYFLNLEKRQYNKKYLTRPNDTEGNHGNILEGNDTILQEQVKFYSNLYISSLTDNTNADIVTTENQYVGENIEHNTLNNDEQTHIDNMHITESEIFKCKKMQKPQEMMVFLRNFICFFGMILNSI